MGDPVRPTEPGQRVRALSYGGAVRQYHTGAIGVVVRFTRAGNPVVRTNVYGEQELADTYGCFRVIDDTGAWQRAV